MKWHIVGATGYVGRHLLKRIPVGQEVLCYGRNNNNSMHKLDLANVQETDLGKVARGDYVVLLAAISSPDICRDQYELAYHINVEGTQKLIKGCLQRGARVLFFSSDVVVGETEFAVSESMPVHPVGDYGKMKRQIEELFENDPKFKVFRLSYVFSREDKFMWYLQHCVKNGEKADVFGALYRNVVYLEDVLEAVIALEKSFNCWENTVFHLSGPQLLCRADLANIYKREIAPNFQFHTCTPPEGFVNARPNCIETKSLYLSALLGRKPTSMAVAMKKEFILK